MNELQIFNNVEFGQIRSVTVDNEPWFVGKDIASALGYVNTKKALIDHVDNEDKIYGVTIRDPIGREQHPVCINESGLYALIFGSRLESAKKFKRWVTSEVLPTIRKHGSYGVKDDYLKAAQIVAKCDKDRLPYVLDILHKGGFSFEQYEPQPNTDIVELLNRYSLTELCRRLPFPKTSLYYYRLGKYKPNGERRRIIIETLSQ